MKNQNDLIAWIVSGVVTIIFVVICFTMVMSPSPARDGRRNRDYYARSFAD